jgi:hypothetical protein
VNIYELLLLLVVQVTRWWRELLEDCIIIYIKDSETKPGEIQGMWHLQAGGEKQEVCRWKNSTELLEMEFEDFDWTQVAQNGYQ